MDSRKPCGAYSLCPALADILIKENVPNKEIASICNCSNGAVSRLVVKRGYSKKRAVTDKEKREWLELAKTGMSYDEIGKMYNRSHVTVSTTVCSMGYHRGRGNLQDNKRRTEEARARAQEFLGDRFTILEYAPRQHAVLRCNKCGCVFDRVIDMTYETTCPACTRARVKARELRIEKIRIANQVKAFQKKLIKEEEHEFRLRQYEIQKIVNLLGIVHVCPQCGKKFRSIYADKKFCSDECRKKYHRQPGLKLDERAKKYGVKSDPSVNLKRLIKRDGLTCYLCGKTCNLNDKRYGDCGPDYPTVEHVIPLSKGGTNTWDNVRVACFECNCKKSDKLIDPGTHHLPIEG